MNFATFIKSTTRKIRAKSYRAQRANYLASPHKTANKQRKNYVINYSGETEKVPTPSYKIPSTNLPQPKGDNNSFEQREARKGQQIYT